MPDARVPASAPSVPRPHRPLGIVARGAAMGVADVVPGVSGGTVALLVGIYPRLIAALGALTDRATWRALVDRRWGAAWRAVDGTFLVLLVAGLGATVIAAAGVVEAALHAYRPWVYAAFVGLVAASTVVVWGQVRRRGPGEALALLATAVGAYVLVGLAPTQTPDAAWFTAVAGAIGICALVLPGISGAFLLVLLGQYERVLGAIAAFDLATLAPFAVGAGVGLLGFARVLACLLRFYPDVTHAVLAGFLLGSLRRIWPWQAAPEATAAGELVLLAPPSALAGVGAAALAVAAFAAVLALEAWSRRR